VILIAVRDLDVDAGLAHASRDIAEPTWFSQVQSQDENVAYFQNEDARRFTRIASGSAKQVTWAGLFDPAQWV